MKKIYLLFATLTIILLSGCSHTSTVEPNLNIKAYSDIKLPYTIAIDGKALNGKQVNQDWDMSNVTVNYGDALLISIKKQLENNFEKVYIMGADNNSNYDYKFTVKNNIQGYCSGASCRYDSDTRIVAYDINDNEIFRKDIEHTFQHKTPGSVFALAFLTGFTLFILSPITMPSMAAIRGNELNKDISISNDRTSEELSDILARYSLYIPKDNRNTQPVQYTNKYKNNDIQKLLSKYPSVKIDDKKWLFIISIEDYEDTDNVLYAKRSAEMFEKVAQKTLGISKRNTYSLINNRATSGRIKDRLRMLLAEVKEGDSIYFYYSGHGIPDPSDNGQPYILPSDKLPSYINQDKFFALKNIYKMLDDSKATEVVAFVDSCFSGSTDGKSILKGVASSRLVPKEITINKSKMAVITAGSGTEFANMYEEKNHRLFSYYLMKSLLDGDKNVYTIYKKVSSEVYNRSNIMGPLYRQEPVLKGSKNLEL